MERPKLAEMIGNEKKIKTLMTNMINKANTFVHGSPGIGKTSSVYAIAEELKLEVIVFNASDERSKEDLRIILGLARTKGFQEIVILLDEIDGVRSDKGTDTLICKILKQSVHPVVLTANEAHKVSKNIKDLCKELRFFPPYITQVLEHVNKVAVKHNIRPKYEEITQDVRSSLITAIYGGEGYRTDTIFDTVKKIFLGELPDKWDKDLPIWLMDNASQAYQGADLYKAIQIIALASRTQRIEVLSTLPKGKSIKPKFPSYFRQIGQIRKKKTTLPKRRGEKKEKSKSKYITKKGETSK